MRRKLLVHGLFLVIALGLAYYASRPIKEGADSNIELLNIEPDNLTQLLYESEKDVVIAKRLTPARGDGFWVTHTTITYQKAPSNSTDKDSDTKSKGDDVKSKEKALKTAGVEGATKDSGTKTQDPSLGAAKSAAIEKRDTVEFKANSSIGDILNFFNPLKAIRVIPIEKGMDLGEFGLGAKVATLKIISKKSAPLSLRIGKKSYGTRNIFVQISGKKQIILINGNGIDKLRRAKSRLFERNIIGLDFKEITKAYINTKEVQATWHHTETQKKGEFIWTDDRQGATKKPQYKSFLDKVRKLQVIRYATSQENQELGGVASSFEISFFDKSKKVRDKLIMRQLEGSLVKDKKSQKNTYYFVKSEFLTKFVLVNKNRAEALIKDIPQILAQED